MPFVDRSLTKLLRPAGYGASSLSRMSSFTLSQHPMTYSAMATALWPAVSCSTFGAAAAHALMGSSLSLP